MTESEPARTVLLLIPSIRGGGMERLVSILLRGLDRSRFRPVLFVLSRNEENVAFRESIPPDVRVIDLQKRSRFDAVRVVARLARTITRERPVAAIGFMTYANLLLLLAGVVGRRRVPVIATEHVTPDSMRQTLGKRVQLAIASRLYRRAASVVAVSEGMRRAIVGELHLPPGTVHTIYNPWDPEIDRLLAAEGPTHPWLDDGGPTLVAVGRLTPQKAYPGLLRALARIRQELPARLLVMGDGEELGRLEALAHDLNVDRSVAFLGFVANPFRYMRAASAYVLPSDWEGFPFVLVEASRAGAAIVSTDCPYGPDEIIDPERSGLLVPPGDPDALAAAVLRVLREPGLADRLRAGARARSELFSADETVRRYGHLIASAAARSA